jgi:hypothetical protein
MNGVLGGFKLEIDRHILGDSRARVAGAIQIGNAVRAIRRRVFGAMIDALGLFSRRTFVP